MTIFYFSYRTFKCASVVENLWKSERPATSSLIAPTTQP
jgi:hypothetical protein